MVTAQAVANEFFKLAASDNTELSYSKLVCLLYYTYGYYLAETDERLFDEPFMVSQHGLELDWIKDELAEITKETGKVRYKGITLKGRMRSTNKRCGNVLDHPEKEKIGEIIDNIWELLSSITDSQAVDLMKKSAPCIKAEREAARREHPIIRDEYIYDYHHRKVERYTELAEEEGYFKERSS